MSANSAQMFDKDVVKVHQHLAKSEKMLVTMHNALCEILRCETASVEGSIAMKYRAEKALVETNRILNEEEV